MVNMAVTGEKHITSYRDHDKNEVLIFPKHEIYFSMLCDFNFFLYYKKSVKQVETVLAMLKVLETRLPNISYEMA